MTINISTHPVQLIASHINSMNPSIPTLTKDDISIRNVSAYTTDKWERCIDKDAGSFIPAYPTCKYIEPPQWGSRDNAGFVVKKDVVFPGGSVTIAGRSDNYFDLYIGGVLRLSGTDYRETYTVTLDIEAGTHEVFVRSFDNTGGAGLAFAIDTVDSLVVSDTTWPCLEYTGRDPLQFMGTILETTVEVDVKIAPSEMYGDYVTFRYARIPIENLFNKIDEDAGTTNVEVKYPIENISMLSGAINNFKDIYQNWYRFSHTQGGVYPAKPNDLNGWSYIEAYDCIQSTSNAGSYIGFISDDFADDYIFNTLISSQNADDDIISINLGAFKQGDVDAREHTLSLACSRGGLNRSFVRLEYNQLQADYKTVAILDPNKAEKTNNGIGWGPWYTHVYARRTGKMLHIFTSMQEIPTVAGKTRDEILLSLVEEASEFTEDDFVAKGYRTAVIDLSVSAPMFNRSVRYGYGQYSQAYARFWNIRRPNDNPQVTPELKQYFLDTFGLNTGDDGIAVENIGLNRFKVSFDNVIYLGDLYLHPE